MANTMTDLIPTIYNSLDVVSRELTGMIPAVTTDMTFERAAIGQTVRSPVAPAASLSDISPAVTPPNDGDQTIGSVSMTINRAKRAPIRWNGEERLGLNNNGAPINVILRDQFAQAMRALVNAVEADLCALYVSASRAHGSAGTPLFSSNLGDIAQVRKILVDNGAPAGDLQFVMNTAAGASLRTLGNLSKANESGDTDLLRRGVLMDVYGMALRESAQIVTPAVGTVTATTNSAGYAVGSTQITLSAAAVALKAGDIITFAYDTTNQYVVAEDLTGTGGVLKIREPGLRVAMPAATQAITVAASKPRNMAFARSAIALATRVPALPLQGDSAVDRTIVTDPQTGLSFEVAMYAQYRQMQYEVSLAWGVAAIKPEHIAVAYGSV